MSSNVHILWDTHNIMLHDQMCTEKKKLVQVYSLYNITQRTGRILRYVESYVIQKAGMNIGNMYIKLLHFAQRSTPCRVLRL